MRQNKYKNWFYSLETTTYISTSFLRFAIYFFCFHSAAYSTYLKNFIILTFLGCNNIITTFYNTTHEFHYFFLYFLLYNIFCIKYTCLRLIHTYIQWKEYENDYEIECIEYQTKNCNNLTRIKVARQSIIVNVCKWSMRRSKIYFERKDYLF